MLSNVQLTCSYQEVIQFSRAGSRHQQRKQVPGWPIERGSSPSVVGVAHPGQWWQFGDGSFGGSSIAPLQSSAALWQRDLQPFFSPLPLEAAKKLEPALSV